MMKVSINMTKFKIAVLAILIVVAFLAMPRFIFSQTYPAHGFGFIPLRSQSPIQQLRFGIQHHPPWTVPKGTWALQLQHTWKNVWLHHQDLFRIDGEIHETVLRSAYGLNKRLEVMVELPVRYLSGGILDGFIEAFHNTFGFGQAARDQFSRDQFAVEIHHPDQDEKVYRIGSEKAGWQVGNMVTSFSYLLVNNERNNFRALVTGNLKLPTGSQTELFGSQGVDFGLSVGICYNIGNIYPYLNGGMVYYSDDSVLGMKLRQWHATMLIAFEYHNQNSNHSWILQGLVESGVAENFDQFSQRTSELLIGYKHRYQSGLVFEIGILENLFYFDNSPDVAFHVGLVKFI